MQCENRNCYVVGAMSLSLSLRPCPAPGDYVIAADRGYDSLMAYGVNPDLVVGDFDSLGEVPNHPNVIQLPAEKDDTDMVFALRQGLDLGYRRFVMLGGVGGRLEHTLGNLQLLDWLASQGAQGFLAGEKTVATAVRSGTLTFPAAMSGALHHDRELPPGGEQPVFGPARQRIGGGRVPAAAVGGEGGLLFPAAPAVDGLRGAAPGRIIF